MLADEITTGTASFLLNLAKSSNQKKSNQLDRDDSQFKSVVRVRLMLSTIEQDRSFRKKDLFMGTQHLTSEELHKRLGEKIKDLRIQKSLSQTTLAQLSGLSVRSISQIEHGQFKVTLADLNALVQALHTTISHLLRGLA